LGLYADPIIGSNLAYSEFKIKDLMNHEKPISLYLIIKPNSIDRIKPLIRLILNQILRILISDLRFHHGKEVRNYRHKMLLMLDEFASLGKLEIFQTSLAYMAGYGIKSYIILQDLSQLYNAYGKDEAIISNSHIRIAYAPNKVETAELLSKMSGTTTIVKKVRTSSGSKTGLVLNQVSENYQEVQRPLLTVDECMSLPSLRKDETGAVIDSGDMLIFIAGNSPIYGKQILYFNDKIFSARAKVEAPLKSDKSQDISSKKLESMSLDDTIIKNSTKEDDDSGQYYQQKRGLSI
jgi:type IV secretion system protein VirD4